MLESDVDVSTKNFLYWFIEGEAHFGIAKGASEHGPQLEEITDFVCKNNQWKI